MAGEVKKAPVLFIVQPPPEVRRELIYLAGKIRGREGYQRIFAEAADKLRLEGKSVYNPAAANLEGQSLRFIMAYLLPQLCDCDSIALLPGWWRSGGARIEWLLARYLGLRIIYL